jgi:hypothetical protein
MAVSAIAMQFRESSGPIDTPWGSELRRIEKRVWDGDASGIRARWESGHHILKRRKGKLLPKGLLQHLGAALEVSRRELIYRVQFALAVPTEDELRKTLAQFPTWTQIITKSLPRGRSKQTTRKTGVSHAVLQAVVTHCRAVRAREELPSKTARDLQAIYMELHRLFKE